MARDLETYLEETIVRLQEGLAASQEALQAERITGAKRALENLLGKVKAGDVVISKTDRRNINRSNALFVFNALRDYGSDWFLAKDVIEADPLINRDATQAKHWGLIEEARTHTGHGKTDGFWRVTPRGQDFVRGRITVPKYRLTRAGRLVGFEGDRLTFAQALGEIFDYDTHMARQPGD